MCDWEGGDLQAWWCKGKEVRLAPS